MQWLTILCYLLVIFSMNWLIIINTMEFDDTLRNEYDDTFYIDNNYMKRQYPYTTKRYRTMIAEKHLWHKLLTGMKTGNLQRLMPSRITTALRFG
ncbi:unnamed protein product [Schistosoma turkestanicum]|nr:unnamed protein product [Schistosoma turkestanicum]